MLHPVFSSFTDCGFSHVYASRQGFTNSRTLKQRRNKWFPLRGWIKPPSALVWCLNLYSLNLSSFSDSPQRAPLICCLPWPWWATGHTAWVSLWSCQHWRAPSRPSSSNTWPGLSAAWESSYWTSLYPLNQKSSHKWTVHVVLVLIHCTCA